ncbi:hypothetical protein HII28_02120 [Planctomonas sp. JC2975]|uniref:hypothetical protein n=1 Tax=Planctomonas sp. JC2975 TaxID=2729626 RepID=UPI00147658D6|nr:hypothetical protein [Planctomonas sp. JC2975]NNC10683.1 hypothetical protein [Planctomonas sp. JC2975]
MADAKTDTTPDTAPETTAPEATAPTSEQPEWPKIEPEAPKGYDQTTGAFTA